MRMRKKSYKKNGRKKYKRETEKKKDEAKKDRGKKYRDAIAQTDSVYLSPLLLPSPSPSACPWLR